MVARDTNTDDNYDDTDNINNINLTDVISIRHKLTALLRIASTTIPKSKWSNSKWYPASDLYSAQLTGLKNLKYLKNVSEAGLGNALSTENSEDSVLAIDSLSQLRALSYSSISGTFSGNNSSAEQFESNAFQQSNCLLKIDHEYLDHSSLSSQQRTFPTTDEVQKRISEGNLLISVHNLEGYNFSLEFAHVYRGKTDQISAYADTIIVLRRALKCSDSSMVMTEDDIDKYAGNSGE